MTYTKYYITQARKEKDGWVFRFAPQTIDVIDVHVAEIPTDIDRLFDLMKQQYFKKTSSEVSVQGDTIFIESESMAISADHIEVKAIPPSEGGNL